MWTILLDIDGTLIRTDGAGMRAIQTVMLRHFGIEKLPNLELAGCTDKGIWTSLFQKLELDLPEDLSALIHEYCYELKSTLSESEGCVLPGVEDFLKRLQKRSGEVAIGLLTGNAEPAAWIKLEHFGLSPYVQRFGGFGDFDADRNDVAARAWDSASSILGTVFEPNKVAVIGDTIRDIECARSVGAKVVTVETGGSDREKLLAAKPDLHLIDLTQADAMISILEGGGGKIHLSG